MMAAEELGIDYDKVRAHDRRHRLARLQLRDRRQPRHLLDRHGDGRGRARRRSRKLCERAAKIWEHPGGRRRRGRTARCRPAGANAGNLEPLSLKEIAGIAGKTGGPIAGHCAHQRRTAPAPSFATHICRCRGRPRDRRVDGPALHRRSRTPARRSIRAMSRASTRAARRRASAGRSTRSTSTATDGRLQNPGFLDYRMPVASDLPMIDTVIVEVPNPRHPYGVRGVGETPIVPPMAAIANAVAQRDRRALDRAADVAAQGAEGARRGARQGHGEDLSLRAADEKVRAPPP